VAIRLPITPSPINPRFAIRELRNRFYRFLLAVKNNRVFRNRHSKGTNIPLRLENVEQGRRLVAAGNACVEQ